MAVTLEQAGSLAVKVPVGLYAIGLVVHNVYLSAYGLYDFELVQGRYLLVGGSSALVLACLYLALTIRLDFDDFRTNLRWRNLRAWLFRASVVALMAYCSLSKELPSSGSPNEFALVPESVINAVAFLLIGPAFTFLAVDAFLPDLSNADRVFTKRFLCVQSAAGPAVLVFVVSVSIQNAGLRGVLYVVGLQMVSIVAFGYGYLEGLEGFHSNPLSPTSSEATQRKWSAVAVPVGFSLLITYQLSAYSRHVYPLFPPSAGGGRPVPVEVSLDEGTARGLLISEGSEWLALQDDHDGVIRTIRKDKISSVTRPQGSGNPIVSMKTSRFPSAPTD